jgi:hypothetical protein
VAVVEHVVGVALDGHDGGVAVDVDPVVADQVEALLPGCRPCRQPSTSWTLVIVAGSPPLRLVKSAVTVGSNSFSAASQSFASTVSKMESTNSMISACSLMTSIVG